MATSVDCGLGGTSHKFGFFLNNDLILEGINLLQGKQNIFTVIILKKKRNLQQILKYFSHQNR